VYRSGALATTADEPEAEPEPRKDVIIELPSEASVHHSLMQPMEHGGGWAKLVERLRFPSLLIPDKALQLTPYLAEDFTIESENEGCTVQFTLHPKAEWRRGPEEAAAEESEEETSGDKKAPDAESSPVTAEDVAATWQLLLALNPELEEAVADIRTPASEQVVVQFHSADPAAFWRLATVGILPEAAVDGISTRQQLSSLDSWTSRLSAGPFYLADQQEGQWFYAAHADFLGEAVELQELSLHFRDSGEPPGSKTQAETPVADIVVAGSVYSTGQNSEELAQVIDGYAGGQYRNLITPYPSYVSVGLNMQRGPLRDRPLRKALAAATAADQLVSTVLGGYGLEASSPFLPDTWAAPADEPDYGTAEALLAEAGYEDVNGDGFVEDPEGERLELSLVLPGGKELFRETGEALIGMWAQVGIRARIEKEEPTQFMERVFLEREFDGFLFAWPVTLDPNPTPVWHTSETQLGGVNPVGFAAAGVNRCLERGVSSVNYVTRQEAYQELANLMRKEVPHLFLFWPGSVAVAHSELKGIEPSIYGLSWKPQRWTWQKSISQ
jgi:peptide/nickel transport system substrate-binding protein